ncbi:hypothetical protein Krodi_0516 [Sporocytophaga myxococcoides]|uniref:Uncharacterized protein n=1 Tax=Sporocytophaga myxococcoides TaxID=153721 RepID=A0A098LBI4_9BACT|nr:hypothetical protein [Sporocytophaga myxococcoides]GAL84251.1 hypothetical protein Krodi_0516 [Sporocytophaga myxococcoides]
MANCKYCNDPSGTYELCREHYYDSKEGTIDKCKCGQYKDSEYEFCIECFKKNKNGSSSERKKVKVNDNSIKGRLAEAIVEEMFLALGYRVFRFGMENTVPGFSDRYLPKTGDVANQVRKMPDFIIVKESMIAFIEVKYRTSGEFDFNEYYESRGKYPYPNAYFILVTPKHIKIQKAEKLEAGEKFQYLGNHKDFETDKDIILQYIEFCKKFFGQC